MYICNYIYIYISLSLYIYIYIYMYRYYMYVYVYMCICKSCRLVSRFPGGKTKPGAGCPHGLAHADQLILYHVLLYHIIL